MPTRDIDIVKSSMDMQIVNSVEYVADIGKKSVGANNVEYSGHPALCLPISQLLWRLARLIRTDLLIYQVTPLLRHQ